ncbi:MAG: helix-turn-helix transcriptional regulator [Caulobacterales bacterium]|nr:helix-turn-helix transcriptional regulator [Caulobacterales bacterium]
MARNTQRNADAVDRVVGRRIAERRAALGRSQTALAQDLGISFQQLQKYEAGLNRVSASRLHHIARLLGVPVGELFPKPERDDPTRPEPPPGLGREGRALLAAFERIPAPPVRRAVTRIVAALAE